MTLPRCRAISPARRPLNAIMLDIAMGSSTNTVLHLLAARKLKSELHHERYR
ncbi:dihydroxy-acid dehydratase [Klebsiella pneumoniae]|uniref:dihydroxy-acid dehydratase domain-containing protein n=1 Tax=Klebsiella pneumoniae TaxID=573 RepID=UPI00388E2F2E